MHGLCVEIEVDMKFIWQPYKYMHTVIHIERLKSAIAR